VQRRSWNMKCTFGNMVHPLEKVYLPLLGVAAAAEISADLAKPAAPAKPAPPKHLGAAPPKPAASVPLATAPAPPKPAAPAPFASAAAPGSVVALAFAPVKPEMLWGAGRGGGWWGGTRGM
jgi:hypothetical protein